MGGVSPVLCRIRCTPFCAGNALPLPAMAVFLQLFLAYDCMNQDTKDNSFKWVPQALMVAAASERPRMPHASSRPPPDATSFIVFATAAMASQFSRAAAQRWPHSYVASAGVCGAVCACGCRCVVLGEALRGWLRETLSVHSNCDDPKMPEDLHIKNERGYAPQASSTQRAQSPHASAGTSCEDLDRDFHHVTTISLQMAGDHRSTSPREGLHATGRITGAPLRG